MLLPVPTPPECTKQQDRKRRSGDERSREDKDTRGRGGGVMAVFPTLLICLRPPPFPLAPLQKKKG